jgi:hypothetical protein
MTDVDLVRALHELAELRCSDLLSEPEYQLAKARILKPSQPDAVHQTEGVDRLSPHDEVLPHDEGFGTPPERPEPADEVAKTASPRPAEDPSDGPTTALVPSDRPMADQSARKPATRVARTLRERIAFAGLLSTAVGGVLALGVASTVPLLVDPVSGPVTAPELAIIGTSKGWPVVLWLGPVIAAGVALTSAWLLLTRSPTRRGAPFLVLAALAPPIPAVALLVTLQTPRGAADIHAAGVDSTSEVGPALWLSLGCCVVAAMGALAWFDPLGDRRRVPLLIGVPAILAVLVGLAAGAAAAQDTTRREIVLFAADDLGPGPIHVQSAPARRPIAPHPGHTQAELNGGSEGLYAGTSGGSSCDRESVASAIGARGLAYAAAWADAVNAAGGERASGSVQSLSELRRYMDELTPVLLRYDTLVTNHRSVDSELLPFQAVLQAGTAVLVDSLGMPRIRCADGAPLTASRAIDGEPSVVGRPWSGFALAGTVTVTPSAEGVRQFGLIDPSSGATFRRPVGTLGDHDVDQVPTTALLDGGYYLQGEQTSCNLIDCELSQTYPLTIFIESCPSQCRVSALDGEWEGSIPLTFQAGAWSASGTVSEWASFTCDGAPNPPTYFSLELRVISGEIADQVWTANQVESTFRKSNPPTACSAGHQSWAMRGSR